MLHKTCLIFHHGPRGVTFQQGQLDIRKFAASQLSLCSQAGPNQMGHETLGRTTQCHDERRLISGKSFAIISILSFFLTKQALWLEVCFLLCAQLKNPVLVAVILVTGIGGTFHYGFHISVLTAPSAVSSSV